MTEMNRTYLQDRLQNSDYHRNLGWKIEYYCDYEYVKVVRDEDEKILYEIFFSFWNWTKYPTHDHNNPYSVSLVISVCDLNNQAELNLGSVEYDDVDLEDIENTARDFHEFARIHQTKYRKRGALFGEGNKYG